MIRRLYLEGNSYSQIARLVGTSQQNVLGHVRRLIKDREIKPRRKKK